MKILIIDDSERKYKTTAKYINKVLPDAGISWEVNAKAGVNRLLAEDFDFVVVDMYMPINSDGKIDREGGFYVLAYMDRPNNTLDLSKAVVNSSEETIRIKMNERGYEDVAFIHNSSIFDLTRDFERFLKIK